MSVKLMVDGEACIITGNWRGGLQTLVKHSRQTHITPGLQRWEPGSGLLPDATGEINGLK